MQIFCALRRPLFGVEPEIAHESPACKQETLPSLMLIPRLRDNQ